MNRKKIVQKILIAIPVALLALFAVCDLAIHTSVFRNFLGSEIRAQALAKTGAHVDVASIEIPWSRVAVILQGVIIHGADASGAVEPLARAPRVEVALRLLPLLRGSVQLSGVLLDQPVIRIRVDAKGRSNLPAPPQPSPPSSSSATDRIFSLEVGDCAIRSGEVYYNDAHIPLNAELHNVAFASMYHSLSAQYQGSLSYDAGRIAYGAAEPLAHSLRLNFTANRAGISIDHALLSIGGSRMAIEARLTHYEDPAIDGSYQATLLTAEVARAIGAALPSGEIETAGTFDYHAPQAQPFLAALSVQGRLQSGKLSLSANRSAVEVTRLSAAYELRAANLAVQNIEGDLLGGHLRAGANVQHIDTPNPASHFDAILQGVSLTMASNALASRQVRRIPLSGTANLQVHGALAGSIDSLVMHARLDVASPRRSSSSPSTIPVSGRVEADYDAPQNTISFGNSYLQTASTKISMAGKLRGGRAPGSHIQLTAHTTDLHEVAGVAQLIRQSLSPAAPVSALDLGGTAALTASVTGTLKNPQVQGHLAAQNLMASRSRWRLLALDFDASPAHASVRNGMLVAVTRGQAEFAGSAALRGWSPLPQGQIALQTSLTNLSIGDLIEIAQMHYPVSGTLSGHIAVNGTEENPQGEAALTVARGSAWGESFDALALNANFGQRAVQSEINLKAPAGEVAANVSYDLSSRQYTVKVEGRNVQLEKIASVERLAAIRGTANLSANGSGTLDNPQLEANLSIPNLQVQEQAVSGLAAQVSVANREVALTVHGGVDQGTIDAKGNVALTGAKYATATLDVRSLPVAALLARFVPLAGAHPMSGQIEAHLAAQGPLSAPEQMEAHLEIAPMSVAYAGAQISLAKALQADYRAGILTVAPARIEGPGTNLTFGGTVPIRAKAPYALSADGDVDLAVLQKFDPELHSSGHMNIHLKSGKSVSQLGLNGTFSVENAVLSSDALPVGIEGLNAKIALSGTRADIVNFSGTAGGGNVTARGFLTYGKGGNFNVAVDAKSVRVRYPEGLRSVLSAQLSLQGAPSSSALTGRVLVDRLSFTQAFDLSSLGGFFASDSSGSPSSALARNMKVDVAVQSSQDLSLANSKISMAGSANLRMTGTIANPVLLGRIALTGGDVFFLSKRFAVQSGTIQFANSVRTDPVLNLDVDTTVEQYDVKMKLSGPIDRLHTAFTSDPPLPPADIIHLLAFGNTNEEANAQPSQSAQMGAESVLASGVSSQVAGKLENVTGLSQVTLDPLATNSQGNPGAQIAIQERVTGSILFTFSTDVTTTQYSTAEIQYELNKKLSVNASREPNGGYALDLRYHKAF